MSKHRLRFLEIMLTHSLMPILLKPYSRNDFIIDGELYKKRLSRMRKSIEYAFGVLFAKWRLLSTIIETEISVVEVIPV